MFILITAIIIFVIILIECFLENKKDSYSELSYNELLQTKEWKAKRQSILKRDNNKCVFCGRTNNLQVHHKYYSKYPNGRMVTPWNYPDDALITLCKECHSKVHNKYKIKVYYRSYSDNY